MSISRVRNTAFADLRGQLEQWCQCRRLLCQSEQSALEFERQHRLSLRSALKSDAAYLRVCGQYMGVKDSVSVALAKKDLWKVAVADS